MAGANENSPVNNGSNVIRFSEVAPPDAIERLNEAARGLEQANRETGLHLGAVIDLVHHVEQAATSVGMTR